MGDFNVFDDLLLYLSILRGLAKNSMSPSKRRRESSIQLAPYFSLRIASFLLPLTVVFTVPESAFLPALHPSEDGSVLWSSTINPNILQRDNSGPFAQKLVAELGSIHSQGRDWMHRPTDLTYDSSEGEIPPTSNRSVSSGKPAEFQTHYDWEWARMAKAVTSWHVRPNLYLRSLFLSGTN